MAEAKKSVRALLSGRVQGVGFRWFARAKAEELGVSGWVANLPDGRVEAWVEGEPTAVDAMLEWLRQGPPHARVDQLVPEEAEPAGYGSFQVESGRRR